MLFRSAKEELVKLEIGYKELLERLHDLEIQISSVHAKIDALSESLPTTDLDAWQKQIESLETEIKAYDEQVEACKTNLEAAREQLNSWRRTRNVPFHEFQVTTPSLNFLETIFGEEGR